MRRAKPSSVNEVALPWSEGLLSARIRIKADKTIAGVPELGLHCYGNSQPEAVFRLFTVLLKYYRQLKTYEHRLGEKGKKHLRLLSVWVEAIENKMKMPGTERKVVGISNHKH